MQQAAHHYQCITQSSLSNLRQAYVIPTPFFGGLLRLLASELVNTHGSSTSCGQRFHFCGQLPDGAFLYSYEAAKTKVHHNGVYLRIGCWDTLDTSAANLLRIQYHTGSLTPRLQHATHSPPRRLAVQVSTFYDPCAFRWKER